MNDSAAMGTLLSYLRILENGDSPFLQFIGKWAYKIYEEQLAETFFMYGHLLLSAVFPIIVGAHSALRQPPSAARSSKDEEREDEDDDDDGFEDIVRAPLEGMSPTDAIVWPLTAGAVLTGLYFFIKWMGNARLLNQIMTVYFSGSGIFAISNLVSTAVNFGMKFVFPNRWSNGKETFYVDAENSRQIIAGPEGIRTSIKDAVVSKKTNPFPGPLSSVWLPARANKALWCIRAAFKKHWIFRCVVYGVGNGKEKIELSSIIAFTTGFVAILHYNFIEKTWWITNLMAFGFGYGAMQFLTPTTFATGSLVLSGLFIYDVVMVFYTPMMKTVALALEVPVKMVFPGPKSGSMLGLGDVVLPGMMLAMALRFDLYLHYYYKQVPLIEVSSESDDNSELSLRTDAEQSAASSSNESALSIDKEGDKEIIDTFWGRVIESIRNNVTGTPDSNTEENTGPKVIKERFIDPHGQWADRFWTHNAPEENFPIENGGRFPKPYFKAGITGYIIAMITTLYVCTTFNTAQPALLYLVPGTLLSLWGTALIRKEVGLMWEYTEDGKWGWDEQSAAKQRKEKSIEEIKDQTEKAEKDTEHARHIFLISLSEPKHVGGKKKVIQSES